MSNQPRIDLKPVIDEATSVPVKEDIVQNELGYFHSATSTMKSGAPAGNPVSSLPKSHLGDFLQRLTKIDNGTLVTTDTYGLVKTAIDPWQAFLTSSFIADKVSTYQYIRGSLQIQISINAPAGAYGLYVLCAIPFGSDKFEGRQGRIQGRIQFAPTYPHVFIDLATCTDGTLTLYWNHWLDYATISDTTTPHGIGGMWEVRLYCMQPIGTATGTDTPQGTYRIWARCTSDHDMVIPYTQMSIPKLKDGYIKPSLMEHLNLQMMPNTFDEGRSMVNNEIDNFRDSVNKSSIEATGMKPSGIAGAIATGAAAIGAAVPFLAPLAGTAAAVASGASAVLSWFGFTREMAQQVPTVIVRRNYSNVANMNADDSSEVAGLLRENAISIDPRLIGNHGEDESAFNFISQKWVLIGDVLWSPTDGPQDELVSFPVTPFISRESMASGAAFTAAGFLGFPFSYWRGDMEYMIIVPFSKFHRGVLQISWTPVAAAPVDDITNTRYNHILDCSTCTKWEFSVGYANPRPVLDNIPHVFNTGILSSAGANGIVTISVANPLTSPVETATTRIWVFARGCANMDFSIPRTFFQPTADTGALGNPQDFATGFRLQMMGAPGALGNDQEVVKKFVLLPGTTSPTKELISGEHFDSIRGLVQKFSQDYVVQRTVSASTASTYAINHFRGYPHGSQYFEISQVPVSTTATHYFTWCGYYSAIFNGVAASTRYKFVNNSSLKLAIGVSNQGTQYGLNTNIVRSISTVNPIWSVEPSEAVEITVPYYYNYRFWPTFLWVKAVDVLLGTARGRVDQITVYPAQAVGGEETDYTGLTGYVAYGPDVRFSQYRSLPLIVTDTVNPAGWTTDLTPPG